MKAVFAFGRLTGFAPVITLPQSVVLLLHHSRQDFFNSFACTEFVEVCPRLESNQHLDLRRILFYPLNYEGIYTKILSQSFPFDNNKTLAYNLQYIGASYSGSINALGAFGLSSILSAPTHSFGGPCLVEARKRRRVSYIGITLAFQANERSSTLLTRSEIKKTVQFIWAVF